ncbi:MAG: hypothetical protein KUG79_18595 [Pseudomonadales bacterium]|nr:hypothetical protein [Pseudomonadales bacterium]
MTVAILIVLLGAIPITFMATRQRWLAWPLFWALILRLSLALVHHYVWMLPQGRFDARRFDYYAELWATVYGCGGFFEHVDASTSYIYSSILSVLYACVGYSPLGAQFLNAVLGTLAVGYFALACSRMWGWQAAQYSAYLLAVFPFLIVYSAVGLREAFILVFFAMGIYALTNYCYSRNKLSLVWALLLFYLSSLFHDAMAIAIVGAIFALLLRPILVQRLNYLVKGFLFGLLGLAALSMCYFFISDISFNKLGNLAELDIKSLGHLSQARASGGAAYLVGFVPNSGIDLIWHFPIRLVYFLFSPFPWDVDSPQQIFGLIDSLIYLSLITLLFLHRRELMKNPAVIPLLMVIFSLALVFAFGTSNFGTATRHRAKFCIVLVILIAPLLLRRKAQNSGAVHE